MPQCLSASHVIVDRSLDFSLIVHSRQEKYETSAKEAALILFQAKL